MKQLLDTFDSDAFLSKFTWNRLKLPAIFICLEPIQTFFVVLKTMALTREVKSLQEKVKLDANSTLSAAEIKGEIFTYYLLTDSLQFGVTQSSLSV